MRNFGKRRVQFRWRRAQERRAHVTSAPKRVALFRRETPRGNAFEKFRESKRCPESYLRAVRRAELRVFKLEKCQPL